MEQCLSIVTACIPYLKPFFESLETGMLRGDGAENHKQSSHSRYGSERYMLNNLLDRSKNSQGQGYRKVESQLASGSSGFAPGASATVQIESATNDGTGGVQVAADCEDNQMTIECGTGWAVRYENR